MRIRSDHSFDELILIVREGETQVATLGSRLVYEHYGHLGRFGKSCGGCRIGPFVVLHFRTRSSGLNRLERRGWIPNRNASEHTAAPAARLSRSWRLCGNRIAAWTIHLGRTASGKHANIRVRPDDRDRLYRGFA